MYLKEDLVCTELCTGLCLRSAHCGHNVLKPKAFQKLIVTPFLTASAQLPLQLQKENG